MTPIRSIIFDIGNVLMTFNPREFIHSLVPGSERAEACFSLMLKSPEWRMLDQGLLSVEKAKGIFCQRDPSLADAVETFFQHWLDMFQPIEETTHVVKSLRARGYSLIILSNFIRESFLALQSRMTFLPLFDRRVVSYEIGMVKPDRDIYEHLLRECRIEAGACLFIDDMESNIRGAEAVGISTLLFRSPGQLREELQKMGLLP